MSAMRIPQALSPEQALLLSRLPLVPLEVADPEVREELLSAPRVFRIRGLLRVRRGAHAPRSSDPSARGLWRGGPPSAEGA